MNEAGGDADADKRLAAEAAVAEVRPGMLVGLGTGSTAAHAIRAIGRLGFRVEAVATSEASAVLAREVGIVVHDFATVSRVDLTIDGADEIDDAFRAIKGAGGAMLREKVVAAASDRMVVIADASKRVRAIGAAKLPVEVMPFAAAFAFKALKSMFGRVERRGTVVTDNGNWLFDCRGSTRADWDQLAASIQAIPGIVGHGLFLSEVDAVYIAERGRVFALQRHLETPKPVG